MQCSMRRFHWLIHGRCTLAVTTLPAILSFPSENGAETLVFKVMHATGTTN